MTTVRTGDGVRSRATVETVGRNYPDADADCFLASWRQLSGADQPPARFGRSVSSAPPVPGTVPPSFRVTGTGSSAVARSCDD